MKDEVSMQKSDFHRKTSAERKQEIEVLTKQLEDGVSAYLQSDKYKELLNTFSKFHQYSLNNNILIAMQTHGKAQAVASFTTWKSMNRYPRKGEKGIKILCPAPFKFKQQLQKIDGLTQKPVYDSLGNAVMEEKEITIPAYKVGYVFDVSQTDGEPLPEAAKELADDVHGYEQLKQALEQSSDVPIEYKNIDGAEKGYYSLSDNQIVIKANLPQLQTCKTLLHETVHSRLHSKDNKAISKVDAEIQAESVAYIVSKHLGLDTDSYSFPYIGTWAKSPDKVKDNLEVIRKAANELITRIDHELSLLEMKRLSEQTQINEPIKKNYIRIHM